MSGFSFPQPPRRGPYLFADGANASKSFALFVERYWPGENIDMDWAAVARAGAFHKVFVYDALPVQKEGEEIEIFSAKLTAARERLAAIGHAPDTHVRTGLTRAEGLRGRLRQKGVDIQLAVDTLSMAHRGAFSEVVIWTSDLDFLPLFEELVLMGVTVTLWHPPRITTDVLIRAADRASEVTSGQLYGFLPQQFRDAHPFPQATMTPNPTWDGVIPVQWEAGEGPAGYVELSDGQYAFVWRNFSGPQALEMRGRDLELIRRFSEDQYGVVIPPHAIAMLKAAIAANPEIMGKP